MSENEITEADRAQYERFRNALILRSTAVRAIQHTAGTVPIEQFKGKHHGERCSILANGESLERFPKDWPGVVIGLNASWRHVAAPYHCMIDAGQIADAREAGASFRHVFVGVFKQPKRLLWEDLKCESVSEVGGWGDSGVCGFSLGLARYGAWMPSVTYFALQVAHYMGVNPMYLWGLDLKGGKFHDRTKRLEDLEAPVATVQNLQLQAAAQVLEKRGVAVYNCNPDSACSAFPKIRPEEAA